MNAIIDALDGLRNSYFIFGGELWEEHFDSLLHLVKDYVVNIWEAQKIKLYGDDLYPSLRLKLRIWGILLGLRDRVVRIRVREISLTLVIKFHSCQGDKPDTGN